MHPACSGNQIPHQATSTHALWITLLTLNVLQIGQLGVEQLDVLVLQGCETWRGRARARRQ